MFAQGYDVLFTSDSKVNTFRANIDPVRQPGVQVSLTPVPTVPEGYVCIIKTKGAPATNIVTVAIFRRTRDIRSRAAPVCVFETVQVLFGTDEHHVFIYTMQSMNNPFVFKMSSK
ncbi:hypothetical protein KIPB_012057, partial [Kipferlia bialata]|eukprot:g12057.t1